MDAEKIKQISRIKYDHKLAKLATKEKYVARMLVSLGGGTFRVSADLLSFLSIDIGEQVVLIDIYDNPIKVDRRELLRLATQTYTDNMNAWYKDHQDISSQR